MMKKLLLILFAAINTLSLFAQATNLFISEYIEGSSFNKAIEIYNGTGQTVDLTSYSLKIASNGGDWGNEVAFTGTLANGEVYVVSRSDANATITAVADLLSSTVINFNGDDAMGLFYQGTLIDVIGTPTADPGTAWNIGGTTNATTDHTLVRKSTVASPNTDWTASAGTSDDNSEWIVYEKDNFTYIGSHGGEPVLSDKALITGFIVENQVGNSIINETNHTVVFTLQTDTDVTAIVPTISVSTGATISPATGVTQDFTQPVVYTVTAENGTTIIEWTVSVEFTSKVNLLFESFDSTTANADIALEGWTNFKEVGTKAWIGKSYSSNYYAQATSFGSNEANKIWLITPAIDLSQTLNEVLSFNVNIGYWTHNGLSILISENFDGTNVTTATWVDITSEFTIPETPTSGYGTLASAGESDLSGYEGNVNVAFVYTGDATASQTTTYQVDEIKITGEYPEVLSTEAYILSFSIAEQTHTATIDTVAKTVALEVVHGTSLTALVPTITVSEGATISPASGVSQNFSNIVVYTVTAEDGTTSVEWDVTVTVAELLSDMAEITGFSLSEEIEAAVINSENATVTSLVEWDTDVTSLTPSITISVGAQISPTTSQDFSAPVKYFVTAQNGTTVKEWTVTVNKAAEPSHAAEITAFELTELSAAVVINSEAATITGSLVAGTNASALTPTITTSEGATYTPTGVQNFTNPVVYTVSAQDGETTKNWTVTLTVLEKEPIKIHAIQFTEDETGNSPLKDEFVKTKGVVAALEAKAFYLQDGDGAWNSVYVYQNAAPTVVVGDSVVVEGKVAEYNNLTEITSPVITVLNSGNSVANPVDLTVADFKQEMCEGVLVTISNVTCVSEVASKNWKVKANETTDTVIVRNGIFDYTPVLGQTFISITGFGGQYKTDYQLFPRSADDVIITSVEDTELAKVSIYPNPVTDELNLENLDNVSIVMISNILGQTVQSLSVQSTSLKIECSDFEKGIYILTLKATNGSIRSEKFIKE